MLESARHVPQAAGAGNVDIRGTMRQHGDDSIVLSADYRRIRHEYFIPMRVVLLVEYEGTAMSGGRSALRQCGQMPALYAGAGDGVALRVVREWGGEATQLIA